MKRKDFVVKRTYLQNVVDFTNNFKEYAINTELNFGLPAEAVLAQAALETGWGSKVLTLFHGTSGKEVNSNNIFNIKSSKSWAGEQGYRDVWEDDNKNGKRDNGEYQVCWFRIYPSIQDSFNDYAKLITENSRYFPALKAAQNNNTNEYVRQLQLCGYATDGLYAQKIISIIESNWQINFIDVVQRQVSDDKSSDKEEDRQPEEKEEEIIIPTVIPVVDELPTLPPASDNKNDFISKILKTFIKFITGLFHGNKN